jgi:hypothetical protein
MKRRIRTASKIATVSSGILTYCERKQSPEKRKQSILAELGIDAKEWQNEQKLVLLNKMAKGGLICL